MTRRKSTSRALVVERIYRPRPEKLLQALRVLLSDAEIEVLIADAQSQHKSNSGPDAEQEPHTRDKGSRVEQRQRAPPYVEIRRTTGLTRTGSPVAMYLRAMIHVALATYRVNYMINPP